MSEEQLSEVAGEPIISRDPANLPGELLRGADIAEDLDPLADGILMDHQKEWLEDDSELKLAEKGRRTGVTFAEALDATLISAASTSAGGANFFYIGDTKDKGREFIGYVAHFAKTVAKELSTVEEFLFEDEREDGSSKFISAFRVTFASGYRVEALSSRPANIRGLQGVVCIDEAAFHQDVREVIDAVNALLIWGGKVRIISTHNGVLNPFNELIREAKSGKSPFSLHFIPFGKAVENGLFRRVCLKKGETWTKDGEEKWEALIRGSYGLRVAAMRQELDAIPAEAEGSALTRVQIENRMEDGIPFERWTQSDDFKSASDDVRQAAQEQWCRTNLLPHLKRLNPKRRHCFGEDFARSGDATDIVIMEDGPDLVRRQALIVEMRNIPFDQQRDVLFYICDRLPNLSKGALDSTGNGAYLAEKATQRYGEVIEEVTFSQQWYREEMPPYIEAFGDGTIVLCQHEDVLQDHQSLQYVDGIIRVPRNFRFKGSDGFDRHGDSAIASALAFFASRQEVEEFGYTGTAARDDRFTRSRANAFDDDDAPSGRFGAGAW